MELLRLIPLNLLIVNLRLRISDFVFGEAKKTIKLRPLLVGISVGGALYFYPTLLSWLELGTYSYVNMPSLGRESIAAISLYIGLCLLCIACIFLSKKIIFSLSVLAGLFVILGIVVIGGSQIDLISTSLLYFIIVATAEELLKYLPSRLLSERTVLSSDLILIAIIIALGFGFIENILYAFSATQGRQNGVGTLVSRGATSFLMHSIFTGSIAAIGILTYKNIIQKRSRSILGLLCGIALHTGYNLIVTTGSKLGILIVIFSGYILLSYLLFRSDSVFIREFIE